MSEKPYQHPGMVMLFFNFYDTKAINNDQIRNIERAESKLKNHLEQLKRTYIIDALLETSPDSELLKKIRKDPLSAQQSSIDELVRNASLPKENILEYTMHFEAPYKKKHGIFLSIDIHPSTDLVKLLTDLTDLSKIVPTHIYKPYDIIKKHRKQFYLLINKYLSKFGKVLEEPPKKHWHIYLPWYRMKHKPYVKEVIDKK